MSSGLAVAEETVCASFEAQAVRTPDAVALLCGGRSLTYRQLDGRANALAHRLRDEHGVGPDTLVALLLSRSERMLVSMLGVLKAAGAYVPINPDFPSRRVRFILADAEPAAVVTEPELAPGVAGWPGPFLDVDARPAVAPDPPGGPPGPDDLAYVMYTSGSTGQPKGVMLEHHCLSNFIGWCQDEYRDSLFDVVYAVTPYGFDLSNIELFFPLTVGVPIRLLPSPEVVGLHLRRDRNVLVNTVPSVVQALLQSHGALANVSVLNLGGEAVPESLYRALGSGYPGMELRNMYGPTETTSTAINYRMHGRSTFDVLIGEPIAHTDVVIADDDMRPLPDGDKGEICIGGRGVARGYLNRPELTAERFVAHPSRPGERIYRTGDLGLRLPDGNYRCFGRQDNQVKVKGHRIELDEIGARLASHPSVAQAVVGVHGAELVAVVQAVAKVDDAQLVAHLKDELPAYMVPTRFRFVHRLPLSPTGKVDRHAVFPQERS